LGKPLARAYQACWVQHTPRAHLHREYRPARAAPKATPAAENRPKLGQSQAAAEQLPPKTKNTALPPRRNAAAIKVIDKM